MTDRVAALEARELATHRAWARLGAHIAATLIRIEHGGLDAARTAAELRAALHDSWPQRESPGC